MIAIKRLRTGLVFALALASPAAADECRPGGRGKIPDISFTLQPSVVNWHYHKTNEEIRVLRARSGGKVAAVGPNWQSIGLTLATTVLAVDVRVEATPIRGARSGAAGPEFCARLIWADVKFWSSRLDA